MTVVQRGIYALGSLLLLGLQHLAAWLVIRSADPARPLDADFWIFPLKSALEAPGLSQLAAVALVALSLAVSVAVAWLSFRAAQRLCGGHPYVVLSVVPLLQLLAVLLLATREALVFEDEERAARIAAAGKRAMQGVLAGAAIIVLAVLISAVSFGAYGWGLFVATPFFTGAVTAYVANLDEDVGLWRSTMLGMAAALAGSMALLVLALEGLLCIAMAAPLALPVVLAGAALGRSIAKWRHDPARPFYSLALLPLVFAIEAAMPPETVIETDYTIDIAAPPGEVWSALVSSAPIRADPGLTGLAGLAYPVSGQLAGEGIGARRIGTFSTGLATEEVTAWQEGEALAFRVLDQPPAMEEMSPYRRVHAPHVEGYFLTGETRFDLMPTAAGGTRLRVSSEHLLRIDPVPYWEPLARLAIRENVARVLDDIRHKAERVPSAERLRPSENSL